MWIRTIWTIGFILFLTGGSGCIYPSLSLAEGVVESGPVRLTFGPDFSGIVLGAIANSQERIEVEMYELSDRRVLGALKQAADRKVLVRVILCPTVMDNPKTAAALLAAGVQVLWYPVQQSNQCMHLKLAVFDGKMLMLGSPNWTHSGLKLNHEGVALIGYPMGIRQAMDQFEIDWRISQQFPPSLPENHKKKIKTKRRQSAWHVTAHHPKKPRRKKD